MIKRRTFIKGIGAIAAWSWMDVFANQKARSVLSANNNNILLLIQLVGGNDGLNTVIPLKSYEFLLNHRKNIIIPEKEIITLGDDIGLHPAFAAMKNLFDEDKLTIVQNVGYEDQNRSHFRSMDIWNTASPANEKWTTGWLGRYLDTFHENYPENYPNYKFKHPLAITIGEISADTCQGKKTNFSYTIDDVEQTRNIEVYAGEDMQETSSFLKELSYLNTSAQLANDYTKEVTKADKIGSNKVQYPEDNLLAQQLKTVAKLISGGLQTQIYTLTLGGFDTHAYQVAETPTKGMHAQNLKTLAEAIKCFQDDLEQLKVADKVIGMTYSEFGRQIQSNSANGTDHGDAAPLFIFGNNLNRRVVGQHPVIEKTLPPQAALPIEFDFRDVYGNVLQQHFGASANVVTSVFNKSIVPISLIS